MGTLAELQTRTDQVGDSVDGTTAGHAFHKYAEGMIFFQKTATRGLVLS